MTALLFVDLGHKGAFSWLWFIDVAEAFVSSEFAVELAEDIIVAGVGLFSGECVFYWAKTSFGCWAEKTTDFLAEARGSLIRFSDIDLVI